MIPLALAAAQAPPDPPAVVDRAVAAVVRAPLSSLQVAPADPGAVAGRRWAAWAVGRGEGQAVHLALFDAHGRRLWSAVRADAYAPTLTPVPAWTAHGRPLILLTLSYGAAAQTVELLAQDAAGPPRVLARRDAAAIDLRTSGPGAPSLVLRQAPGSEPEVECLRWDAAAAALKSTPCR